MAGKFFQLTDGGMQAHERILLRLNPRRAALGDLAAGADQERQREQQHDQECRQRQADDQDEAAGLHRPAASRGRNGWMAVGHGRSDNWVGD